MSKCRVQDSQRLLREDLVFNSGSIALVVNNSSIIIKGGTKAACRGAPSFLFCSSSCFLYSVPSSAAGPLHRRFHLYGLHHIQWFGRLRAEACNTLLIPLHSHTATSGIGRRRGSLDSLSTKWKRNTHVSFIIVANMRWTENAQRSRRRGGFSAWTRSNWRPRKQ